MYLWRLTRQGYSSHATSHMTTISVGRGLQSFILMALSSHKQIESIHITTYNFLFDL